ncbi:uncharacterized protein [Ptychodera flava]
MGKNKVGAKNKKGYMIYTKEEFKEEYPVEQQEKKKKRRSFLRRRRKKKNTDDGTTVSECSAYSSYSVYTNSSFHYDDEGSRLSDGKSLDEQDPNERAVDVPAGFLQRQLEQKRQREREASMKSEKRRSKFTDGDAQRIGGGGSVSEGKVAKSDPYQLDVQVPLRVDIDQTQPPKKPPRVKSTAEEQTAPSTAVPNLYTTLPSTEDRHYVYLDPNAENKTQTTSTTTADIVMSQTEAVDTNQPLAPPKPKRLSQNIVENEDGMTVAQVHVVRRIKDKSRNEQESDSAEMDQDMRVMDNVEKQLRESLSVESVLKELDDTISEASEELIMEYALQKSQTDVDKGVPAGDERIEITDIPIQENFTKFSERETGSSNEQLQPQTPPPTPVAGTPPPKHTPVIPYKKLEDLNLNDRAEGHSEPLKDDTDHSIGQLKQEESSTANQNGVNTIERRPRRKSSKGSVSADYDSEEDDDDGGIFDESYRASAWIYVGENDEPVFASNSARTSRSSTQSSPRSPSSIDSGFSRDRVERGSTSTTASEAEFQMCYQSIASRKRILWSDSGQSYSRLSANFRERTVNVVKKDGQLGFRIQFSKPVRVTGVDKGGAAEEAGLQLGDAVLEVNGMDVMMASHYEVVKQVQQAGDTIKLVVGTCISNALNLPSDQPIISGYLMKQGGTGLKLWRKRYFVLKHDNCLYYYKTDKEKEPVGAIVLPNYTVTKVYDKNFTFKLMKYGAKTYYLHASNEDEMNRWAGALTEATNPQNKGDPWLDISTHNVGLPALSISQPDCHGYLFKMGGRRRNWRRRYCVLKDACFYYYVDEMSPRAQGVAHFHGYSIQETELGNKRFAFTLTPPHPQMRTWYFNADHDVDRKRWISALAESIGRWICIDKLPSQTEQDSIDGECEDM